MRDYAVRWSGREVAPDRHVSQQSISCRARCLCKETHPYFSCICACRWLLENQSRSTRENAVFSVAIAAQHRCVARHI